MSFHWRINGCLNGVNGSYSHTFAQRVQGSLLFVTYTIIQGIISNEM